ncbi:hypothetical protein JCM3775_003026 [Rhodotorula graminis]
MATNTAAPSTAATATATESVASFDPLKGYAHSPPASSSTAPRPSSSTSTSAAPRADSRPAAPQQRPSAQPMRRRSSRRSARGDDPDDSLDSDDARSTSRRGTTARRGGAAHRATGVQPPKDDDLFDTDDAFQAHADAERASGWHHLPLFLVGLPSLGAVVHGRAEHWSDAIILALVVFYLYQLIKVPWELYYASYARSVLPVGIEPGAPDSDEDPQVVARRAESAQALRRNELMALWSTFLVPVVGASLLHYARGLLSDPDRFINRFLIGLFAIASSVKPVLHFVKLVKHNSLYHQEVVHYPSSRVHQLQQRVDRLEKELSQLSRTSVPLSTFESLSSSLSSTLTPLQRQLRRQTLETQHAQLSSTERLSALAGAVDELCLAFQAQDQELVALRDVVASRSTAAAKRSPALGNAAAVLGSVVKHLVVYLATPAYAHRRDDERERHGVAWYALWPVTVPRALVGWAVKGTAKGAVKALGWEGDAEAAAAASSAGAGGGGGALDKGRNHRRITSAPSAAAALAGGGPGADKEEVEPYSEEDDGSEEEDDLDLDLDLDRARPAPASTRAPSYSAPSYMPYAQQARYARTQQQVPVPVAGRRPGAGLRSSSSRAQQQQRVVGAA